MTVSLSFQHGNYSRFDGESVQEIYSLHNTLNFSDRRGAPNANRWHKPPDLPPRTILKQTEMSSMCSLFLWLTFVLKLSPDELCTTNIDHATLSLKNRVHHQIPTPLVFIS
jgi:hypothetical protein